MNKKIAILGAGESGTGAAMLASKHGYEVWVSDGGTIKEKYKNTLMEHGILFEENTHSEDKILCVDEVIKSPGIPDNVDIIKKIKAKNIPVIDELEFASRYTKGQIIGITGTNGKTTTTSLIFHMMKKAGLDVALAGNIGESMAKQVAEKDSKYWVLELSSYQLDGLINMRIHYAILCNITPDHLDRYDYKIEGYINSKFSITKNQTAADHFIYCDDDLLTKENINNHLIKAQKWPFSIEKKETLGAFLNQKTMEVNITPNPQNVMTYLIEEFSLKGKHNIYNSMATAILGQALGIRKEIIRESFADFVNVEHRLESLGKVRGIDFINDSKATNVNSTWYALESMEQPTIWIAGGIDKGNDYEKLKELVKEKVKIIVCLGTDNRKIHESFSKEVEMIVNTTSMQEAVAIAYRLAVKDDAVLLSPACASFDLFQNYEDRGRQFKKAVRDL